MIKETDLVSYLPPFVAEFKEITAALEAENPEFTLVWNAADQVLQNEFIETADEYGISRFEKILNIFPSPNDTLEGRRARIMTRWFVVLPYTIRTLTKKLISLCGEKNFIIETDFDFYRIKVETMFDFIGQTKEVEELLEQMIPSNIVIDSRNHVSANSNGNFYVGGAIYQATHITINTELEEKTVLNSEIRYGGCISDCRDVIIETASHKER